MSKVTFNEFVKNAYRGIPERTTTIEEKERAIEAKKMILNHPDCPQDSKIGLRREIATIEEEIASIREIERTKSMNSSIFPQRNLG